MTDEHEILTEAEATRLWQRAAQLQAEEARRAEARAVAEAEGSLVEDGGPRSEGYALTHVRTAALEAGIGEEFVQAALAEVQSERLMPRDAGGPGHRVARWLLRSPGEALTTRRTIRVGPAAVLASMEALFSHEPHHLTLRERVGDPTAGGTLIFDIQGVGFSTAAHPGFRRDARYADLRQVFVTLAPLPGEEPRTDVTLRAPVAWALGIDAGISGAMSAVSGGIGMMGATAIGSVVGLLNPVAFGLLVAAGGGLGGAAGLSAFRALYRYGHGRGTRALEALLAAVAAKAPKAGGGSPRADPGERSRPARP